MAILCGLGGLLQPYWGHLPAILPGLVSNTAHLELSWPILPPSSVILGPSWPHLGRLGRVIIAKTTHFHVFFACFRKVASFVSTSLFFSMLAHPGLTLGDFGAISGRFWGFRKLSRTLRRPSWVHLWAMLEHPRPILGNAGLLLGPRWAIWG